MRQAAQDGLQSWFPICTPTATARTLDNPCLIHICLHSSQTPGAPPHPTKVIPQARILAIVSSVYVPSIYPSLAQTSVQAVRRSPYPSGVISRRPPRPPSHLPHSFCLSLYISALTWTYIRVSYDGRQSQTPRHHFQPLQRRPMYPYWYHTYGGLNTWSRAHRSSRP
ncbi:hypothetical protein FA15DRAFT_673882 [Coprinopsis marcescibilis]|uniref:Uncharacterized protein n=1 Tax=Coprinopsis marcescibilis TaxID=230819 RepID=A0A5C3KJD5_COPMA|nr:hypothetical protein FA15DRAFT_673882 [Coprinopsis marcescibilis]